jgi:hypothetical protein
METLAAPLTVIVGLEVVFSACPNNVPEASTTIKRSFFMTINFWFKNVLALKQDLCQVGKEKPCDLLKKQSVPHLQAFERVKKSLHQRKRVL